MPDNNTNGISVRARKAVPDAVALCAFAEHALRLWRSRVLGEVLAEKVGSLTMRMTRGGENAAQMAELYER